MKRLVGLIMSLALCFSAFAVPAFAATEQSENSVYTISQNEVTQTDDGLIIPKEANEEMLVSPRAGVETWYKGSRTVGSFNMTDDNLTPVNTIGESGTLDVWFTFYRSDQYSSSPIKLTFQIRNATTGQVYGTVVAYEGQDVGGGIVIRNVPAGTKIQLYFDASSISNPPGPYRQAYITYGYTLS